ncbi:unnamed protein product [Sphenostylis stenocarpa]|uniref:Uncharacterized protein n=1 Tax=Sphenostylis stenocarpa TaxID=92480 RepID=A0AA86VGY0_9FABA|nr:unnamed protein product [Sphenostylis stenocarpa]
MGERIEMRLKETKDSQCRHLFGQTKIYYMRGRVDNFDIEVVSIQVIKDDNITFDKRGRRNGQVGDDGAAGGSHYSCLLPRQPSTTLSPLEFHSIGQGVITRVRIRSENVGGSRSPLPHKPDQGYEVVWITLDKTLATHRVIRKSDLDKGSRFVATNVQRQAHALIGS